MWWGGAGSSLDPVLLLFCGLSTLLSTVVGAASVYYQLKNYRKPHLQRQVIRIMVMVPVYAISSLISLFSLEAAFFIDAFRDIYEAYVIYCFFHLLLAYLGGDRALLIMLHGRPPKTYLPPMNLFKRECDVSDPFVFLGLRRGIFQYVQVKPLLAVATMILKATNTYHEGTFKFNDGYLYVSVIYNTSICISLYCLAMFWKVVSHDIQPFRPVPKFLCVKGIIFFSFWQSIFISILVSAGAIPRMGPYTDQEHISIGLNDMLICFEMPFFAFAHWYAFNYHDYIDDSVRLVARMPFMYAFRDAFGVKDVMEDAKATMQGGGSYRYYEPAEGGMHQGSGRERRIRAGLRYAQGGKKKYWIPVPRSEGSATTGPVNAINKRWEERGRDQEAYAPLMAEQEARVVHADNGELAQDGYAEDEFDRLSLDFDLPSRTEEDEQELLYAKARLLEFGDGNYPVIDCSDEAAKRWMHQVEQGIVSGRMSAVGRGVRERVRLLSDPTASAGALSGYGALPGSPSPGRVERSLSTDGQVKGKGKDVERESVYGAWAEQAPAVSPRPVPPIADRSASRRSSPAAFPAPGGVIDLAPPAPDMDTDGLRLHLSRRHPVPVPTYTSAGTAPPGRGTSLSPPQHPERTRSPLVPASGRPSSRSTTPLTRGKSLPSDAVDLLIEDAMATDLPPPTRNADPVYSGIRVGSRDQRAEQQGRRATQPSPEVRPREPPRSVLEHRYGEEPENPWA
ncbi:DUF300-domain-containing protein [Dacryopinax primogenitus]|uniref:DUF300-domain-containing protein n=1 Tax=Dacryopinax primogenitus (strain DJM 731) TaxID=1858805 RepID=M5G1K8_DACPD|nr:DUF300-domain-containing protein [Dacryopinax primogenitus]EJT99726.1 DUF300-domain-containing protein [Dacryopinax primogenitus]